jgi:beta-fructofuranosidase
VDAGGHFYAPQTLIDANGRRVMFGWLWEGRSDEAQRTAGWAGVQSLPRLLSLCPDGLLGMEPLPELAGLREAHERYENLTVDASSDRTPLGVHGDSLEIVVEFEPGDADALGLLVRRSPAGEEQTRILCDRRAARLSIDRERSSASPDAHRDPFEVAFALASGEPLRLRVFLDRSVLEVFANGRACLTSRIYPSRPDSIGIALFARGQARVTSLDIWEMRSIW